MRENKLKGSVRNVVRDGGLRARVWSGDSALARLRMIESVDLSPPPSLQALIPTTASGYNGAFGSKYCAYALNGELEVANRDSFSCPGTPVEYQGEMVRRCCCIGRCRRGDAEGPSLCCAEWDEMSLTEGEVEGLTGRRREGWGLVEELVIFWVRLLTIRAGANAKGQRRFYLSVSLETCAGCGVIITCFFYTRKGRKKNQSDIEYRGGYTKETDILLPRVPEELEGHVEGHDLRPKEGRCGVAEGVGRIGVG